MDQNKLFVGGLPWSVTSEDLRKLFASYGEITEAIIVNDRDSGRSKGFGFVTFANADGVQKALDMNGKDVEGRPIVVNVAKPRENSGGGFRRNDRNYNSGRRNRY